MERRNFISAACKLCVLGAAGYILPQTLVSCAAAKTGVYKTTVTENKIDVPLALFETNNVQMIRPKGWFYDIAVIRHEDKSFSAILMKCTHMDNQLSMASDGFHCSLHGSHFDKDGQVRRGPAERPLTHYKTTTGENNLTIYV